MQDWRSATKGTPDYYHACAGSTPTPGFWSVTVPANTLGTESPHGGSAYVGLHPGARGSFEYIQQRLSQTLASGLLYQVEFWASPADDVQRATDNLGIYFSSQRIFRKDIGGFGVKPHVKASGFTTADGWTLIQGQYVANGDEDWLTLGGWQPVGQVGGSSGDRDEAYYYIDDVSVCAPAALPSFTLSQQLCGGPIVLDGSASTGETDYSIQVFRTDAVGSETVVEWLSCQQSFSGTVPANVDLSQVCPPNSFDDAGVYHVLLAVQNACTTFNHSVDWITIQSPACCGFATSISPPGPIVACGDVPLSAGTTGGTGPFTFQWSRVPPPPESPGIVPGSDDTILVGAPEEAEYVVRAFDLGLGCEAQASVDLSAGAGFADLALDSIACEGDDIWVDLTGSVADSYQVEVHETDEVGSTAVVPGTLWQSPVLVGPPGAFELDGVYPFPLEAGRVYRVGVNVDQCSVGGSDVRYVVVRSCDACTQAPPEMVGWWSGEGDARDRSAHAGHGSLAGDVGFTAGQVGQAFEIPELDTISEVVVADAPHLDFGPAASGPGAGDFSIDAWVKDAGAFSFQDRIVRKGVGAAGTGYALGIVHSFSGTSQLVLELADSSGIYGVNSDAFPDLADGQWHHVAVTVDRDHAEGIGFYVDGALVSHADPTIRTGDLDTASPLRIGDVGSSTHSKIDEVEIFSRELNASEVSALHAAGAGGKCLDDCSVPRVASFCDSAAPVPVEIEICNDDVVAHDYAVSLIGLPRDDHAAGQGCTVDGPTTFSPAATTLSVAPGCETLQVAITPPDDLSVAGGGTTTAGATGCYLAEVENLDSGARRGCIGKVAQVFQFCPVARLPGSGFLQPGGVTRVEFDLQNLMGSPLAIDYEIAARPNHGDPDDDRTVRLDGNAVVASGVAGSVTIPGHQTLTVGADLTLDRLQAFDFAQVMLRADVDGDGIQEVVASTALRSLLSVPVPAGRWTALTALGAGLLGAGAWWLRRRRAPPGQAVESGGRGGQARRDRKRAPY